MTYKVMNLHFNDGEWMNLDGCRIVAVLGQHKASAGTQGGSWYVTALVEQP